MNTVAYGVYDAGDVTITVSDVIRQHRPALFARRREPGRYWAHLNTARLAPGVYLIEERVGGMLTGRGKVTVVK